MRIDKFTKKIALSVVASMVLSGSLYSLTLTPKQAFEAKKVFNMKDFSYAKNGDKIDFSKLTSTDQMKLRRELKKVGIQTNYNSFGSKGKAMRQESISLNNKYQAKLTKLRKEIDKETKLTGYQYAKLGIGGLLNAASSIADVTTGAGGTALKVGLKAKKLARAIPKIGTKLSKIIKSRGKGTFVKNPNKYLNKALKIMESPEFTIAKQLMDNGFVMTDTILQEIKEADASGVALSSNLKTLAGVGVGAVLDSKMKAGVSKVFISKVAGLIQNIAIDTTINTVTGKNTSMTKELIKSLEPFAEFIPYVGGFVSQYNASQKAVENAPLTKKGKKLVQELAQTEAEYKQETKKLNDKLFMERISIVDKKVNEMTNPYRFYDSQIPVSLPKEPLEEETEKSEVIPPIIAEDDLKDFTDDTKEEVVKSLYSDTNEPPKIGNGTVTWYGYASDTALDSNGIAKPGNSHVPIENKTYITFSNGKITHIKTSANDDPIYTKETSSFQGTENHIEGKFSISDGDTSWKSYGSYSYTYWGQWESKDITSTYSVEKAYWIVGQEVTDLPQQGSAQYKGVVKGFEFNSSGKYVDDLTGTTNIAVNFGTTNVTGSMDINKVSNGTTFANVSIKGHMDSQGVISRAQLSGENVGSWSKLNAKAFGPKAKELGGFWWINKTNGHLGQGVMSAKKQ